MNNEPNYIEECLNDLSEKLQWGHYRDWTTKNYDALSYDIQQHTGVNISSRTLQRLGTRRAKYSPQTGTKNALAKYLGYENWEDFMLSKSKPHAVIKKRPSRINKFITSNFWLLQFLIVTGLSSFFVFFYPSIELELDKNKIVFQSNDLKGTAPHDATFFYDITKIKSGNVFIDNNCYSEGKTFLLKKNMHYYSHTFPLPDYYAVRVISKGEWLTGVDVHVVTQGWETIINNELYKNIKPYNDSGYLHVNTNKLRKLDVNEENITRVEFRNIRDFHVDCDAMTFETRFMNNASTGGQGCYDSKIEVIGKKGRLSFNFVTPGCDEKLIEAKYGDVYLAGEFNDLNTFFQDISHWRTLKIVTGKKRVGVYLDDVQIYSGMYNMFLDEVKGLSISFIGSGAVDYVKLFNKDNLLVYNDNFVKD